MLKYGSDKPDLRNPIEISDVTALFQDEAVTFNAFKTVIEKGGVVRAIPAPGAASQPRSFFDKLNDWARKEMKAAGLGYITFEGKEGKGPIAKFVPADIQQKLMDAAGVGPGDAVFFACDQRDAAVKLAGQARLRIGEELGLNERDVFKFCWIVDFPMYEWNEDEKRVDFSHNPFSMPQGGMEALETQDPLEISAYQYDIVCNGVELSSGAIRNHRPEVMLKAFAIAGYPPEEVENRFGGMLNAFRFGAPPHGGIAPGVDRMVMLLAGVNTIRDVIMFPLNQQAQDLMMNAPSEVSQRQLKELALRPVLPEGKGKG
jgi:aspartyl-tRNA synthetase